MAQLLPLVPTMGVTSTATAGPCLPIFIFAGFQHLIAEFIDKWRQNYYGDFQKDAPQWYVVTVEHQENMKKT
jgi:hypothetical protein